MRVVRKPRYLYEIKLHGKKYRFVTTRTIAQQKIWFEKVHRARILLDDIKVSVIKESAYGNDDIVLL